MKQLIVLLVIVIARQIAVAQEKVSPSSLEGEWKSSSGASFYIRTTKEGFKLTPDLNSSALFKESSYPVFECYDVKKGFGGGFYTKAFVGSKVTVISATQLTVFNAENRKTVNWIKKVGHMVTSTGDLLLNGKKIASIKKTTNANMMMNTLAEYTIYDVNNIPRFLMEKSEGKLMFLDDNKSFLPRKCDPNPESIGEFFAYDSILTTEGYNVAYRKKLFTKYGGFDNSASGPRDYSAEIKFVEKNIMQGNALIGKYDYRVLENKDIIVQVTDPGGKKIAFVSLPHSDAGNTTSTGLVEMSILDPDMKDIKKFKKEIDTGQLYLTGIKWLAMNGFL